ncbi:MAG: hypothetical protein HC851_19240 [Acaryochloris sp. RU_4_1]|nr:hypothetical protein [Acaryochloris sp. RU_4_1]NJR57040.1 hypothetical protein [Acaryochloris sp. CRU_2_0]
MKTLMIEQPEKQTMLSQWFCQYAKEAGLKIVDYPASESLEDLGIHLVFEHGQNRIALSGSTDENEVNEVFERYQQEAYTEIRQALGIDYLWVLKLTNLSHSANDLFEVICQFFDLEQKPECSIVDL